MAEYQRRTTSERTAEARRRAIERGVPPLANIPPGYRRGPDGRLVVEPREAPIVAEAFRMRAEGATIKHVCAYLREHGIERSWRSTQTTLASRVVLGEINFGELVNLEAHPAIVDPETFRRVQAMIVPARPALGIRAAACASRRPALRDLRTQDDRRLAHNPNGKPARYPMYRCPPTGDCPQRVAISAERVESAVIEHVQQALADVEGRASARANVERAERALGKAQDALDTAIRTLADYTDEPAARDRLAELRKARDDAREQLDKLGGTPVAVTVNAARDWDKLKLEGRRALIAAVVERVTVAPRRGPNRIEIHDVAA